MRTVTTPLLYIEPQVEVVELSRVSREAKFDEAGGFQIVYLTAGSIDYKIDMHSGTMTLRQVLRIRPGETFRFECYGDTKGYLIKIENGFLEGLEHRLLLSAGPTGINIDENTAREIEDLTRKMKNETLKSDVLKGEILRRYTEIFLIHLARSVKGMQLLTTKTRNVELAEKFMTLLDRHYKEKRMVSDYASLLSVTPNYLNEIVKKLTGEPAGYHIRQRITLEAKRHAAHSSLCMKEIAYALGFADMAHFSKFFKNTTGRNFTDYRKEQMMYNLDTASRLFKCGQTQF
jgi:AraC-like DNA-binding protein